MRAIRSEAALADILAKPGYRVREQFGRENVNTDQSQGCASEAQRSHKPHQAGSTPAPATPTPAAPAPSLAVSGSPPVVAAGTSTLYAIVSLCRAAGLPEPVPEYRFHPKRRWRFDYAWPLQKLALEIEGGIWTEGRHTRGAGALADLEKYSEAAILGWRIIYCTPGNRATVGMDRVRRALA